MKLNRLIQTERDQILRIARQYGAKKLRIFGSVARGQANKKSDVDILVEFKPGCSLLDHIALMQDLEELLGRKVDVVNERALHWYVRDRILKEAMLSITLAQELRSRMKEELGEEIFWDERLEFRCIHLDLGEEGPTRELIDSICGMVKGFGFEPVIKPHAYGAFVVADRHT